VLAVGALVAAVVGAQPGTLASRALGPVTLASATAPTGMLAWGVSYQNQVGDNVCGGIDFVSVATANGSNSKYLGDYATSANISYDPSIDPAVSPDGTRVAFFVGGTVETAPMTAGTPADPTLLHVLGVGNNSSAAAPVLWTSNTTLVSGGSQYNSATATNTQGTYTYADMYSASGLANPAFAAGGTPSEPTGYALQATSPDGNWVAKEVPNTSGITYPPPFGLPTLPNGFSIVVSHTDGSDPTTIIVNSGDNVTGGCGISWGGGGSTNTPPTASFTYSATGTPNTFQFTSTSAATGGATLNGYHWNFGDATTSTAGAQLSHTFTAPGQYTVTLTVTDSNGLTNSASQVVVVSTQSTVNSTGDGDLKSGSTVCDTGGTIGTPPAAECTLRAAIELANAGGPNQIGFNINSGPTAPTIALASPLPAVISTVTIDGTTQSGGWVDVTGTTGIGLQIGGANSTVKGLALGGFSTGISVTAAGSTISGDRIGSDATGLVARSVADGVDVTSAAGVTVGGVGSAGNQIDATANGVTGVTSPGLKVTGNLIGTDATGTALLVEPKWGVAVIGDTPATATVSNNTVTASGIGVWVAVSGAAGTSVTGNTVGTDKAGDALLGAPVYGVRVDGTPNVGIASNTVDATSYDVSVAGRVEASYDETTQTISVDPPALGPGTSPVSGGSPSIAGNTLGLLADGVTLGGHALYGVYVWSGTNSATISSNTIAGHLEAEIHLDGGSGHMVTANMIGTNRQGAEGYHGSEGVELNGTDTATIGGTGSSGNVFGGFTNAAVYLEHLGGAPTNTMTTIAGNQIGPPEPTSDSSLDVHQGIDATFATDTVIGPGNVLGGNSVGGTSASAPSPGTAITIGQDTARTTITGNIVGLDPTASTAVPNGIGITVTAFPGSTAPDSPTAVTISNNTVSGNGIGGIVLGTGGINGVTISGNQVGTNGTGTSAVPNGYGIGALTSGTDGPSHLVVGPNNVIAGNTADGVELAVAADVHDNRIGLAKSADQALPNAIGVDVIGGSPNIHNNVIAYNTSEGIEVGSGDSATIRTNIIYNNGGIGIAGAGTPPSLATAARVTPLDQQARTWLVVTGLPTDGSGTLEAFGNPSCADPEGKVPLLLKAPVNGSSTKVLTIVGNANLQGFTVTYTNAAGATSVFSGCATAQTDLPDSNGNGIPDVIESLGPIPGAETSPTEANIPTDSSDWVGLVALQGSNANPVTITSAGPADDPGNHPQGLTLSVGLIQFTLSGVDPGGSAEVQELVPSLSLPATYWKYGPPGPDQAPAWYSFGYDTQSGTGARLATFTEGDGTVVSGYDLQFVDGSRGDNDGATNGTIVDPGGPGEIVSAGGGGGAPSPPTPSSPETAPSTVGVTATRVAGRNRVATAIAVSQTTFPSPGSAGAVVLARGDTFPDALAGAPLAAARHAPILLTPPGSLDRAVQTEIQRVLPSGGTVYLLGGTDALNPAVAQTITGLDYKVVRYAGADRYGTATAVAAALGNPTTVLLADGTAFADALSAGAAAAEAGGAVLLTNGPTMDPTTAAWLAANRPGTVYAVGGRAAAADPDATPVAGADRYATSVAVAEQFFPSPTTVGLASGADWPDALTGSAAAALGGFPVVLTNPTALSAATLAYLGSISSTLTTVDVYGGTGAISPAVVAAASQ